MAIAVALGSRGRCGRSASEDGAVRRGIDAGFVFYFVSLLLVVKL